MRLIFSLLLLLSGLKSYSQVEYRYSIGTHQLTDDRIWVSFTFNGIDSDKVIFHLPKMVPGIYGELNFGKAVVEFEPKSNKGEMLPFKKLDENSWEISRAKELGYIDYLVDDEFEDFASFGGLMYKSPRSMFTQDSVFIINNNSLFGYFEGKEKFPYEIKISKTPGMYVSTSLPNQMERDDLVVIRSESYNQLVDNPMIINRPDTASYWVDDVKIKVACHSTSGKPLAASLARQLEPLSRNQKKYLGGQLPVKEYTFLIYHQSTNNYNSMAFDGLEHSQSTLILLNMPFDEEKIKQSVYSVASHEFFHTVMPLGLHSEEIQNYNFSGPKMSKHLWLYEGMTEYFTMHMPAKQGLIKPETFVSTINEKIKQSATMKNDISLAELGRQAVTRQDEYMNAYARGTLTCMCLDIELRSASKGKYGVQQLIRDMQKVYGKDKPFRDPELFAEMAKVSAYPFVKDFLEKYVDQNNQPPLEESLQKVGLTYESRKVSIDPKASGKQRALRADWLTR